MILKVLIPLIISVLIAALPVNAHENNQISALGIEDVSFNPPFLNIGPKPNIVKVTVNLTEFSFKVAPEKLMLQQIKTLPNHKTVEENVGVLFMDKNYDHHKKGIDQHNSTGEVFYSGIAVIQQKTSDNVRFRLFAEYKGEIAVSEVFTKIAGKTFVTGQGGTIEGANGVIVTIPPDAISYPAQISVLPAASADVQAPIGPSTPFMNAIKLVIEPQQPFFETLSLQIPLQLSFPVPSSPTNASYFIVAHEIDVPLPGIGADIGGIFKRLTPVDTAAVDPISHRIVTESTYYSGIFDSGLYVLLDHIGSGEIQGNVCEGPASITSTCPSTAIKAPEVVVTSNTNRLVALTDQNGQYKLHIDESAPYTLTAFDSMRGYSGTASGTLPNGADILLKDKFFSSTSSPALTGIRNGGFECVNTSTGNNRLCDGYWALDGDVQFVQSVTLCEVPTANITFPDQPCPAANSAIAGNIMPSEGQWMASITTGSAAVGAAGSVLTQRFSVPKGAAKLYFDFIFLSEEFNEFVGSHFNDTFTATVTPKDSTPQNAQVTVSINNTGALGLVPCHAGDTTAACLPENAMFNCGFPGGDATCGKIPFVTNNRDATIAKWATASIDMSAYAGQSITLDLAFTAVDKGDNIYNTQVLLDNLRFNTVFLDVKAVSGVLPGVRTDCSNASDCVHNDLVGFNDSSTHQRHYGANEILSIAGLNLRLAKNSITSIAANPNYFNLINPVSVSSVSKVVTDLLSQNSDPNNVNLHYANVYYTNSISDYGTPLAGIAFTHEDLNLAQFSSDGIVIASHIPSGCVQGGNILAHELGHLLMTTKSDGSASFIDGSLEHYSQDTFMSQATSCLLTYAQIIQAEQQKSLNSSPYLFIEQP